MKLNTILVAGLLLRPLVGRAAAPPAPSPRVQLKEAIEQLQKTPEDAALREKIIQLARTVKPAPALPEEAERRMARGTAAFQGAKSVADYADAAKEYELATLSAPWAGDAYFNLGMAQDKAENYDAAVTALKLAQLASPESKDIKARIYQVEYRREKNSPLVAAQKEKKKKQELAAHLDGAQWHEDEHPYRATCSDLFVEVHHGEVSYGSIIVNLNGTGCPRPAEVGMAMGHQRAALEGLDFLMTQNGLSWKGQISEDGEKVTIIWADSSTGQTATSTYSRVKNPRWFGFNEK